MPLHDPAQCGQGKDLLGFQTEDSGPAASFPADDSLLFHLGEKSPGMAGGGIQKRGDLACVGSGMFGQIFDNYSLLNG